MESTEAVQTTAASAPSAAPTSSAPAPVSVSTPTPASNVPTEANPEIKGSAANIEKGINEQKRAEFEAADKAAEKPAEEVKEGEEAPDKAAAKPTEFQPIKYSVDGVEHEIKNEAHHKSLLQQGHKYGPERRAHLELQRHIEAEYGLYNSEIKKDPTLGKQFGFLTADPELRLIFDAVLNGTAVKHPQLLAAIQNGQSLINEDRIRANVLQRQVDGRSSTEAQQQAKEAISGHLNGIAEKYGIKWFDDLGGETPEGVKLFEELKAIVKSGDAKDLSAAFKLTPKYEEILTNRAKEAAAKEAADKAAELKKKSVANQEAIARASGFSGGASPKSKTSPKKGSDEVMLASFEADQRRAYGG